MILEVCIQSRDDDYVSEAHYLHVKPCSHAFYELERWDAA